MVEEKVRDSVCSGCTWLSEREFEKDLIHFVEIDKGEFPLAVWNMRESSDDSNSFWDSNLTRLWSSCAKQQFSLLLIKVWH